MRSMSGVFDVWIRGNFLRETCAIGVDGRDEPIAFAGKSLNEDWRVGRIAEHLTQLLYRRIQAFVEVDIGAFGPEPLLQILAGDDLSWTFQQESEYLERLLLKRHGHATLADLSRSEVNLKDAESQFAAPIGLRGHSGCPQARGNESSTGIH